MGLRDFEYSKEKYADLISAYRRCLSEATYPFSGIEVLEKTVSSPSIRFWVSPQRAQDVLSQIERGGRLEGMKANKREMFMEIHRRVLRLRSDPKYRRETDITLIDMAINQPAPCFYMTARSAAVFIHRAKAKQQV